MRKISRIYGCPLLVLLLLLLSACGASANETPANTMNMAASSASSDAADDHAQETMEANHSDSPSASPAAVAAPSDEPVETEKPRETDKPKITKEPAASGKTVETKSPASTPLPKSTPAPKPSKAPAKSATNGQEKDKDQPTEAVTVYTVEISNFAFSPDKLEINEGDTVTFINKDEVGHTATADNEDFDTGILAQNDSKKITFSKAGEFSYYCTPHPGMKGTIVVKEK